MRSCEDLKDLILFYSASETDEAEARAVRAHLEAGCPVCVGRLAEAEASLAHLPFALAPVAPSPGVRRALMAKVAAAAPRGSSARPAVVPRAVPDAAPSAVGRTGAASVTKTGARPSFADLWIRPALAAALAAGITGILVFAATRGEGQRLHSELARQNQEIESLRSQVERASSTLRMLRSPAVQVVSLGGGEPQPRAAGRIFWDRGRREWRFYAADLRPPGPGRTYELWFITSDQKKIPAGTFDVNAAGEGELVVKVPVGLEDIVLAAVTDEPAGGVAQPTGQIHLVGKLEPARS